jgi:hypothetical protein
MENEIPPEITLDEIIEDISIGNWSLMKDDYVKAVSYYLQMAHEYLDCKDQLKHKERELTALKTKLLMLIAENKKK